MRSIVVDGEAGFVGHAVLLPTSIQLRRAAALAKCTCRSLQPVIVKVVNLRNEHTFQIKMCGLFVL